jgi:hypothetical protein
MGRWRKYSTRQDDVEEFGTEPISDRRLSGAGMPYEPGAEGGLHMTFGTRWLAAVVAAFALFPIAVVVWNGPDADFGFVGGIILMAFLQFVSPYCLWFIPLAAGTTVAAGWQILANKRSERERIG